MQKPKEENSNNKSPEELPEPTASPTEQTRIVNPEVWDSPEQMFDFLNTLRSYSLLVLSANVKNVWHSGMQLIRLELTYFRILIGYYWLSAIERLRLLF